MPDDILSIYAQSQPDKPGVIDDKPDGTVVMWTYAELEAQVEPGGEPAALPGGRAGHEGPVVRAELARGRGGHERHEEDRRGRRAAELPADAGGGALRHQPQRRRGRLRGLRARADVRRAARPAGEGAAHHRGRRPGPAGPGRDADRRRHRGRAGRRARRRGRGRHGRDDDLHLRHDRQAEGRGPVRRPGSGSPRRPAEPVRLPARRHLHHLRPAVPQRPQRVHGRWPALRPDDHRAAQVRRRGLAAAGGQVQGELDVLRARAGPDDLRAAQARSRTATTAPPCAS